MSRMVLVAGAAAWLMGCAGPMGTLRPATSEITPPVTAFDGSYRNSLRVVSSFGAAQDMPWCDSPGQLLIVVENGQFSYRVPHPNVPGDLSPIFPAVVAADGSFKGQIIAGSMYGQIQGRHIQGRIDGSACVYDFVGDQT